MKRKFVCGIVFCLALSMAGCGKNSEEQQAANYYQNELGLDKEEAEELAHELYGNDDEDTDIADGSNLSDGQMGGIVVEPLPELLNSEWYDFKVQIYDMVFDNYSDMTEEDIRKIVEGSAYNVELTEGFDSEGNISLSSIEIDGNCVAILQKCSKDFNRLVGSRATWVWGPELFNNEYYYEFSYGTFSTENTWYDKESIESIEFMDLKTRDGVLAYLAENGFVELEAAYGPYYQMVPGQNTWFHGSNIYSDSLIKIDSIDAQVAGYDIDIADLPHYSCKGAQSITLYRSHKISETDEQVEAAGVDYSGAHLNYVNSVTFEFDTDGTIISISWNVARYIIMGERM